jgi:hypothetical protein
MTSPSNTETHAEPLTAHPKTRRAATLTGAALAVAVLAAGCGSSKSVGNTGPGNPTTSSSAFTRVLAYARCMRGHGTPDFPDPTSTTNGRHVTIDIPAGSGSDLDPDNPTFKAASRACRSLLPSGGLQPPAIASRRLTEELQWASCVRSHGLPNFPDPNSQGAFDYAQVKYYVDQFNANLPLVVHAAHACKSHQPGSIPAIPSSEP